MDEERHLDDWHQHSILFRDAETHKRLLWRFWPLIAGAGVGWLLFCGLLFKSGYLYLLKQLNSAARHREQLYWERDLSRIIDRS